ncbi:SMP-30/gluconolactonase/LRE family protein [Capillimicrobium parvum]|uniref:SMP-30/gluconolactonase/LRE family protein n=1 Tax=Capillimicrobium parvum TaxID=2884022 RepID=UPI00216B0604|nr:SMP-30/gluconolactonase/LRE family protein [Capillimicrobium parvum]
MPAVPVPVPWGDVSCEIGEGPLWDDRYEELACVDLDAGLVHWIGADTTVTVDCGQPASAVLPRTQGGYLVALEEGVAVLPDRQATPELIAPIDRPPGMAVRCNDAKCDPQGRAWIGTLAATFAPGEGALYRLDHDWTLTRILDGLTLPNGMAWSESGDTMYLVDSRVAVWAFDFDPTAGTLSRRRELITVDPAHGEPDGMAVDLEGGLWIAMYGAGMVRRHSASGAVTDTVRIPAARVTSCAFGGTRHADLFVTTAAEPAGCDAARGGRVFRFTPAVGGRDAQAFAG